MLKLIVALLALACAVSAASGPALVLRKKVRGFWGPGYANAGALGSAMWCANEHAMTSRFFCGGRPHCTAMLLTHGPLSCWRTPSTRPGTSMPSRRGGARTAPCFFRLSAAV